MLPLVSVDMFLHRPLRDRDTLRRRQQAAGMAQCARQIGRGVQHVGGDDHVVAAEAAGLRLPKSAGDSFDVVERVQGAQLVQVIGRTIVLYRRHPTQREIALPT